MVNLILTERIRDAIQVAISSPDIDPTLAQQIRVYLPATQSEEDNQEPFIPSDLLRTISKFLLERDAKLGKDAGHSQYYLHELLKSSSIHIDRPAPREKSPALLAILDSIRTVQLNAEYGRMVSSLNLSDPFTKSTPASDLSEVKPYITAMINILFSMIAVFTAVWWVSGGYDIGTRVLLSMAGCAIVGIAETVLYLRHLDAVEKQREKEIRGRKI